MMNETAVLSVNHLTVRYKHTRGWRASSPPAFYALNDVSLELQSGHILAIVGESGSGKTTLAKCIAGLIRPTAGEILIHDTTHDNQSGIKKSHVQYVFQDPFASLNPGMTIEEVIQEPLEYLKPKPDLPTRQRKLQAIFSQVGLDYKQRHRYPHEFSGGQCQRIAIARALIAQPEILISDEPVSALDVSVRAQVINLLQQLNQSSGLSQIFIAHDLWLTRYLCHDIVVLYQGQVMEAGPCQAIFNSPRHPYTRALIDAIPHADPRLERARLHPDHTQIRSTPAQGCPYAGRCQRAQSTCLSRRPELQTKDPHWQVACFNPMDE